MQAIDNVHHVARAQAQEFAESVLNGALPACPNCFGGQYHKQRAKVRNTWCQNYEKFTAFTQSETARWSIFAKGNEKLPFWAFSALPGITCPGAGECLTYCYSFKAWRYPAAFYRQLQNTLLLRSVHGRQAIATAWQALPYGQTVRLYVDGDIDSLATLRYWLGLVSDRPDLKAYGYSKSWAVFQAFDRSGEEWPSNYRLNLSSGSIYGLEDKLAMEQLPITRGEFIALPSDTKAPNRRNDPQGWGAFARALKATARAHGIEKSFVCPGKCGDCLPNGEHACGSDRFQGVTVIIGIH
jgi:hypothetical protein